MHKGRERANFELEYVKAGRPADPIAFSRATCEHVRAYVERAAKRWEQATEMEAPPHLAALRQISEGFVKEHPAPRCVDCGVVLEESQRKRRRCPSCVWLRNKAKQRAANGRFKRKQRREGLLRNGRVLVRQSEADLIRLFRALGLEWKDIADRFGMSISGVYAKANYDPMTGGEPPSSYYKHGLIRKTDRMPKASKR